MTTQPVGTRRPASLPGGVTGYAGQPVTWSSSRTSMTPFGHPRGADHRVVSGTGTDMAGQRDDVVPGFRFHNRGRRTLQFPGVPAGPGMPVR